MAAITRRGLVRGLGGIAALGGLSACSGKKTEEEEEDDRPQQIGDDAQEVQALVRLALGQLIDRSYITGVITQNGEVPAGTLVPRGVLEADGTEFFVRAGDGNSKGYFNASHNGFKTCFDKAMATLKTYYKYSRAKGVFKNFPPLTYVCDNDEVRKGIGEYLACVFEQVGIEMEVVVQDDQTYANTCAGGGFSIVCAHHDLEYTDPQCMLDLWTAEAPNTARLGKGAHERVSIYDLNLASYGSDVLVEDETWANTYDVLARTIAKTADQAVRCKLMHRAEDMVMETGCVSPLYYDTTPYLHAKELEGHYVTSLGIHCLKGTKYKGSDEVLNVCLGKEPASLDPAWVASANDVTIATHLCAGLARWTKRAENDYIVEADCARELVAGVQNADGTITYTYVLRDGLVWSDGTPLVARDFEVAWRRAASKELDSPQRRVFSAIQGFDEGNLSVSATDDKTLTVISACPVPHWNQLLALPAFAPVREDVVGNGSWANDASTFAGNGAYRMAAWEHGSVIRLEKNDAYWDNPRVVMRQICFHATDDNHASLANFESGTWQLITNLPHGEMDLIHETHPEEYAIGPCIGTHYLCINANENILPI